MVDLNGKDVGLKADLTFAHFDRWFRFDRCP